MRCNVSNLKLTRDQHLNNLLSRGGKMDGLNSGSHWVQSKLVGFCVCQDGLPVGSEHFLYKILKITSV